MVIKFVVSQILNNNIFQRSKKLKFLVISKGEILRVFQDVEFVDIRLKFFVIVSVVGFFSLGISVSWELIMLVYMVQNDVLILIGVYMFVVYVVDVILQLDVEVIIFNNKVFNILGKIFIEVFGLFLYFKDFLVKCYNIIRF